VIYLCLFAHPHVTRRKTEVSGNRASDPLPYPTPLLFGNRASEPLHGGGMDEVEMEVGLANSEQETGAQAVKHRPKRIFTVAEEEQRQQRRAENTQQRLSRLEKIASGETGLGKVRQHVNPLAPAFRDPIPSPDWKQVSVYIALCPSVSIAIVRFCVRSRL